MKRLNLFILVLGIGVSLFAQERQSDYYFAAGSWNWDAAGTRLYQNSSSAGLAKVNIRVPQSGPMIYEFNVRYEGGAEDGHGGFGIHIFANDIYHRTSWGSGTSYLLWLNYDEDPISKDIPKGFSAQVYKSISNSAMNLVESIDLNEYAELLTDENLAETIPFRIFVDADTGEVRVYDPTDPDLLDYYYFFIDKKDIPQKGDWVSVRTNGMKMSFALGLDN